MKKALLLISLILVLSYCDDKYHRLKGGTAITVEGDTIEFYGGVIGYPFFGRRNINKVVIEKE